MKKNRIAFLVLIVIVMLSCADDSANPLSFEDTVAFMESNPRQFLSKLDTAVVHPQMEDENDATTFLLKSMCNNYINENVFPPLKEMEQCVSLLAGSSDNTKYLESLLFLARVYHHEKDIDHEVSVINRALDIAKENKDNRWVFYLYTYLGEIYFYNVDLLRYAEYLDLAKDFYDEENMGHLDVYTRLVIGKTYIFNKQFDQAIDLLEEVTRTIGESHAYYSYSHYLLGIAYFKVENWQACIRHTEMALPGLQKDRSLFLSYSMLTYCCYSTGQPERAEGYKKLAFQYDTLGKDSFIEIEFYSICADFAGRNHDMQKQVYYLNRMIEVYENKLRSLNEKTLNGAFLKYEFDRKRKEYKGRISSYKYMVGFLLLSLAALIWVYVNRRKQQAYRLLLLQEQVDKLQSLAGMSEEVKQMIMRDLEVARRISYLKYSSSDKGEKLLQEIDKLNLLNGNKLLNMQWEDFFRQIDIMFSGFYSRLVAKYPLLGDKEVQLCCMLIAGFRTEEIAAVWGQSIYTVHKAKTSVRKKIFSPEGGDLILFLKEQLY